MNPLHIRTESRRAETVILTWNPDKWSPNDDKDFLAILNGEVESFPLVRRWSTGIRKKIPIGSRAYLLRQSRDRGIVASGVVVSEVYEAEHWDGSSAITSYVDVEWDTIVSVADRLTTEDLAVNIPGISWNYLQGSGFMPSDEHFVDAEPHNVSRLHDLWSEHLNQRGLALPAMGEEVNDDVEYWEGAVSEVKVNKYERSRSARRKCLEHWGLSCSVCGRTMEEMYGPEASGMIHVHHILPISQIGQGYRVNPVTDLRPVCPNCHAVIHLGNRQRTIDEVRRWWLEHE